MRPLFALSLFMASWSLLAFLVAQGVGGDRKDPAPAQAARPKTINFQAQPGPRAAKQPESKVIVIQGNAKSAVILFGDNGPARNLADYLRKITSAQIRVAAESRPSEEFRIHVGRNTYVNSLNLDFDSLHPAGYYLKLVDQNNLVIAGRLPLGSEYGVFDFLKRYCGYRFFMQGELGEVVPKRVAIHLPSSIHLREEPSLTTYMYGINRFCRGTHVNVQATHNLHMIYPPEKYAQTHPEFYPMIDGKRFVPHKGSEGGWQPCVSNPELPRIAVEYAREFFQKNPAALGLSLGVNDGGGDCCCPECLKLREKYKNQYVPFYNKVARRFQNEFPSKLIGFIAYGGASAVPENVALEPNLYVEVMNGTRSNFEPLGKWKQAGARHLGIYGWYYGGGVSGYVVPRHYPHVIGNAWKEAHRDFGLQGAWLETGGAGVYQGALHYVLNELAWNLSADIDGLLEDYFTAFYAEAARPMRQFFDRIEAIYARKPDPLNPPADCFWSGGDPLDQFKEYTPEDLKYLDGKLSEARRIVKHELAAKRVVLLARLWGLSRLHVEGYLAAKALAQTGAIRSTREIQQAVVRISEGLRAINEISTYPVSEEEQKALFPRRTGALKGFRGPGGIQVMLEREADRVLAMSTAHLQQQARGDWQTVRSFWARAAAGAQDETLRSLVLTQVYLRDGPEAGRNLVSNPSVEPEQKAASKELHTDRDLQRLDWRRVDRRLPGWSTWQFPNTVARFYWDGSEAHTGKYSLSIGETQGSGCFILAVPVTAGCRYRLSFWVKQKPPPAGKPGAVQVRWQKKSGGWVVGRDVSTAYPRAGQPRWTRAEATFTAPADAAVSLILFGAPKQGAGEFTWVDDVSVEKVYDKGFLTGGNQ